MKYTEAVEYILGVPKFAKKTSLENVRILLEKLDNPDRKMKIIHVAGTNGKGSVCSYISNILVGAGKRTGLFTSPHLIKINERFKIDNVDVSDEDFLAAYDTVMEAIEELISQGGAHPSFFEVIFAIGLVLFDRADVEYAIIETGLGGRLDTTNVIENPLITVITSISLDHTEILGDTIEDIAYEKAGIIKTGVPVVFVGDREEAARVIEDTAVSKSSKFYKILKNNYKIIRKDNKNIDFLLNNSYYKNGRFRLSTIADYQIENAAVAITAVKALCIDISDEIIENAVSNNVWQGRMQYIASNIIVDGAHNEDGVLHFIDTARDMSQMKKVHVLFTAVCEKDYESMIRDLCKRVKIESVVTTEISNSRNVKSDVLADIFKRYTDVPVLACEDIEEAFEKAVNNTPKEDILFCVGSLYLVGSIMEIMQKKIEKENVND